MLASVSRDTSSSLRGFHQAPEFSFHSSDQNGDPLSGHWYEATTTLHFNSDCCATFLFHHVVLPRASGNSSDQARHFQGSPMAFLQDVHALKRGPVHEATDMRKRQKTATPIPDLEIGHNLHDFVFETLPPLPAPPSVPSKPNLECQTCYETGSGIKFGRGMHAGKRRTKHFNCFKCWEQHIKVQLEGGRSDPIRCIQCPYALKEPDMRAFKKRFGEDLYTP